MDIKKNLEFINLQIEDAKKRVGRTDEVLLLAVTKTVDYELIDKAISLGINDIGENKPQELVKRMNHYGDKLNYHQIGSLQTNKVKYLYKNTKLIHSLDRLSLAKEINKRAKRDDLIVDCLVQVNVSKEETKSGIYLEDLEEMIEKFLEFPHIKIRGLMTMAPYTDDEKILRNVFGKTYNAARSIEQNNYENLTMEFLSMGMTHDYQIAVEEGANIVRVGTAIFGERDYSKKI
ncbi:MAG: YggS family pyridoxal phosphate-dependent enzyme [Tissierellia bacterium]|nr:YggS family pyridoxal phosphate-dependent enzyme [Tissierellia bacterium]